MPQHPTQTDDPDVQKGVVEGDRPDQPQHANPHGTGVNAEGLPNDPVAIAEDSLGANEDESQGWSPIADCGMLNAEFIQPSTFSIQH